VLVAAGEAFDVAVVGGGTAGCVVAARLAESGSRSVVLLEAGPDRRSDQPGWMGNGWDIAPREFDWGYTSKPDSRGSVQNLWRTRLLGGTSWLTRFTLRGSPADYDEWAAAGNAGWSFDDVLPYFVQLEADTDFGDQPWHGDRGPMPSTRYLELDHTEIAAAGVDAMKAVGFPTVDDHNRPGAVGVGRMPMSSHDGLRVTTADAYLPARSIPDNLTIKADTQVAGVLFDGARAVGVRLVDGTSIEAGWVVLCGGTYGSPSILMRSGIGPAASLRDLGIPVRANLPGVGENLADHPAVTLDGGYTGMGRSEPVLHSITTFRSVGRPAEQGPDLMLWMCDPSGPPDQAAPFEIEIVLLRPRSRGTVRLRSEDPSEPPAIQLPSLSDLSDVERLAEGFRRAFEVASRPEIRRLCSEPLRAQPSDRELPELVRAEAYSLPHVVGTCAMGEHPERGAVVDTGGHVYGTERLTVVDASIMPDVPSGFTHIPTIMIAERLAATLSALL
jgi:choline dehydrogenase